MSPSILAQVSGVSTTVPITTAAGGEPSSAGLVVFLLVCVIIAGGGLFVFLQAKKRSTAGMADPSGRQYGGGPPS